MFPAEKVLRFTDFYRALSTGYKYYCGNWGIKIISSIPNITNI